MTQWQVQEAKAKFSEFLDRCLESGPQVVTRRGQNTAVLVPYQDWLRLQSAQKPSLKELLLLPEPRAELQVPTRGNAQRRKPMPL
jgi:prevent-host-death family protein